MMLKIKSYLFLLGSQPSLLPLLVNVKSFVCRGIC